MARTEWSSAVSGSPIWHLTLPLNVHVDAKFGLTTSARSMKTGAPIQVMI